MFFFLSIHKKRFQMRKKKLGSAGVFCFREKRGGGEGSVLQNLRCNNEIVVCVCLCSFPLANNDNSEKKTRKCFRQCGRLTLHIYILNTLMIGGIRAGILKLCFFHSFLLVQSMIMRGLNSFQLFFCFVCLKDEIRKITHP